MKLTVQSRVSHEKYGLGVITEADAEYTVIEFDEHGRKKFLTRLVALTASDEPPPKRRRARSTKKKKTATAKKTTAKKASKATKATKKAAKTTKKS